MKKSIINFVTFAMPLFLLLAITFAFKQPVVSKKQNTPIDINTVGGFIVFTWPDNLSLSSGPVGFGHNGVAIVYTYNGKHYVRYTQHDGAGKTIKSNGPAEIVKMNNGRLDQAGLVRLLKDKILMGSSGSPKYNMRVQYVDVTNDVALKAVDFSISKNGYNKYDNLTDNCAIYVIDVLRKSTKLATLKLFTGLVQGFAPRDVRFALENSSYNNVQVHNFDVVSTSTTDATPRPDDFSSNYKNLPRSYYLNNDAPLD
jgi:hypothetical protein